MDGVDESLGRVMVLDKGAIPDPPSMVTDGGSAHLRAVALFGLAAPNGGKFWDGLSGDGRGVVFSSWPVKPKGDKFPPSAIP